MRARRSLLLEINRLKKTKNAIILAHNYQLPEVQEAADYHGDSLELARKAAQTNADVIVFCGVSFMAETAKILSPEKTVLLPRKEADCPMAAMITREQLVDMKRRHPEAKVVTYVNSSADVKAESDVCCTSANAVKIIQAIDAEKIIFTPDENLAHYCQRFTQKAIIPWKGYCYVHHRFSKSDILKAKESIPEALLLAHPECRPEVIDLADEVLSTSGMLKFARESSHTVFIIGTEEGLIYRLKHENPEKSFYSLGTPKICITMKMTRLINVHDSLKNGRHAIRLSEDIVAGAERSLSNMLAYA